MTSLHKTHNDEFGTFRTITLLSTWGLSLVISSFLLLWIGHLLDEKLGTAPKFMLGLFFAAIAGCMTGLYQAARKNQKNV
ncbi:MAG: AtpZ/AtpI family protein [Deltaproteobacteria bacterium]